MLCIIFVILEGRGRSYMVSDFMVMHHSGPFFYLNDSEWDEAIQKYPELDEETETNYVSRTCTAGINVGGENYFDNHRILEQFERLFKMLEFKTEYRSHKIEILVDNASTHTAQLVNINDLRFYFWFLWL